MNQDVTLAQVLEDMVSRIVQPMKQELAALQEKVQSLESQLDEWVDTKTALRLLGLSRPGQLKTLREKPGSLLKFKSEGLTGKSKKYSRASIAAYNEDKATRKNRSLTLKPLPYSTRQVA